MRIYLLGLVMALSAAMIGCGAPARKAAAPHAEEAAADKAEMAKAQAVGKEAEAPVARKIIYTATIDLVVENIDTSEKDLRQLVEQQKGAYIAKAELRGSPGSPRSGSWTVRVPVAQFDSFRLALLKLGELNRDSLDSQDVTEQFYDLEARIQNNKAREESLRKLLEKAGQNKIEDYLAVQQRLDQVTAELDVQRGQLQRLDKLSTLATVNISMQERKGYVRPEAPGFGSRISSTFGDSLDALIGFGKGVVIVAVALAPWLPVIALFVSPFLWLLRRRRSQAEDVPMVLEATVPPTPPASEG